MSAQSNEGGKQKLPSPPPTSPSFDLLWKFVAPSTLLTALLFYFGWARTNALYRSFGIDQSLLGFSTTDYVLRSIQVAFDPIRWILVAGVVCIWASFAIRQRVENATLANIKAVKRLIAAIWFVACVLLASPLISTMRLTGMFPPLVYPLVWTGGIGLFGYTLFLTVKVCRRQSELDGRDQPRCAAAERLLPQTLVAVIALCVLGLFWLVALYADNIGRWNGRQILANPEILPDVIIYSQTPLGIEAEGVISTQLSPGSEAFEYRYTGLKFLVLSNNRYFLLPAEIEDGMRTVILAESETIRIEVIPGGGGP